MPLPAYLQSYADRRVAEEQAVPEVKPEAPMTEDAAKAAQFKEHGSGVFEAPDGQIWHRNGDVLERVEDPDAKFLAQPKEK